MAEELTVKNNSNNGNGENKGNFNDYKPLEVNLGVFWTAKGLGDKTTLSFNYVRDYLKFNFSMTTDDGKKEQISKKFRIAEGYKITNALMAILADRIATLNNFVAAGAEGTPNYSEIEENEKLSFYSHYFDKEKNENVTTGKITISTVPVNGVNRICIKGYSETEMLQIRVIFYDDFNDKITKVSALSVSDGGDIDFYRFVNEVKKSLNKTFEYACADKLYQAIIHSNRNGNPFNNNNNFTYHKEKKYGFFNKNTQRQVSVSDSDPSGNNEIGVDLFEQDNNDLEF